METEIFPLLSRLYQESNIEPCDYVTVDKDVTKGPLHTSPSSTPGEEIESAEEEDDLGPSLPTVDFKTVTSCIQNVSAYIMQRGCSDEISNTLTKLESLLEIHHENSKVQSKISDLFSKK